MKIKSAGLWLIGLVAATACLAHAPRAEAQMSTEYTVAFQFNNDHPMIPNPVPPVVTLSQGGQLRLRVDGVSSQSIFWVGEQTFTSPFPNVQPYFPGVPGYVDCETITVDNASVDAADGLHPLGLCSLNADSGTFVLTFHDAGTYTIGLGPTPTFTMTYTFQVDVLATGGGFAGHVVYAGPWTPNVFYPLNTMVSTGSVLTGQDFWIETNSAGTTNTPGEGGVAGFDWYHIGPTNTAGPQGPAGAPGPMGPAGPTTPGSVVMLPATTSAVAPGLVAPPAPSGYVFQGFTLLGSKPNGHGIRTSFAVYTKS